MSAFKEQVGGQHYKTGSIQVVEFILANPQIGFFEGSAIKYLTRWKQKGGVQDLRKAIHFIEMLIEHVNSCSEDDPYAEYSETRSSSALRDDVEGAPV